MRDGGLRQIFQKYLPEFHWQSVETFSTGRGVPDLNYCFRGTEGWIELKRRVGNRVALSPEQIAWIERRGRAGGRVFVAVRKNGLFWLYKGANARLLDVPELVGEGRPQSWPWEAIKRVLAQS